MCLLEYFSQMTRHPSGYSSDPRTAVYMVLEELCAAWRFEGHPTIFGASKLRTSDTEDHLAKPESCAQNNEYRR